MPAQCFEESCVAGLAESSSKVLDLGHFSGTQTTLHGLQRECKAGRPRLLTPAEFNACLETKSFTSRNADLVHVARLYEVAYLKRTIAENEAVLALEATVTQLKGELSRQKGALEAAERRERARASALTR